MSTREPSTHDDTLAPLLDVVFILLIALTLLIQDEVIRVAVSRVDNKPAEAQSAEDYSDCPVVEIDAAGLIRFQDDVVDRDQLVEHLETVFADDATRGIVLQCDPDVRHECPVKLMERPKREQIAVVELVEVAESDSTLSQGNP